MTRISRIGGAAEPAQDPVLAEMFSRIRAKRGHVLHIHQVVGHSPKMLRAQVAYAHAMREQSLFCRSDLQELLILRVAQVTICLRADGSQADRHRLRRNPRQDRSAVRLAQRDHIRCQGKGRARFRRPGGRQRRRWTMRGSRRGRRRVLASGNRRAGRAGQLVCGELAICQGAADRARTRPCDRQSMIRKLRHVAATLCRRSAAAAARL